ncbi:CidA/LrgA family protein [Crenobacter sp. SG2305]|uniref:CidA/LrgA family protein n=1 Tax=Crenobacter oryzisoli TaxID=3056844 RepID=UPI0025AA9D1F|nr:CidA/LrgA family protein [Crenobacter sp. SG2305]MDN0084475.1 CidA/LrgA family protein [Crenobacter sp. SG2305]
MLETLLWLFGYQLIGEAFVRGLALPVPGPVLGMLLLFLTLCAKRRVPPGLGDGVSSLLKHMSLFFVPAGVGILAYWSLLEPYLLSLSVVLIASTLITLVGAAALLSWLLRRHTHREGT